MNCLLTLTCFVITTAFITTLIALAVPVWQTSSSTTTETNLQVKTHVYSGLWSVCKRQEIIDKSTIYCDTYLEDGVPYPGSIKGVQSMMILGGAASAAAVVIMIIKMCFMKTNIIIGKIISILCIGAAIFLLLAAIIWSTEVKDDQKFKPEDLSAGFALTIISAALLLMGGVAVCFVKPY